MKRDQERVKNLLTDTVTLLCRNGLQFQKRMKVQGLLGITLDDNEVFLVQIDESLDSVLASLNDGGEQETEHNEPIDSGEVQQRSHRIEGEDSIVDSDKRAAPSKRSTASRPQRPASRFGHHRFGGDITALRRKKFLQQRPRGTTSTTVEYITDIDSIDDHDNVEQNSRCNVASTVVDVNIKEEDVNIKEEEEDDVVIVDQKPDVDESIDRKMMRGAYLAEASANESLDAQDIYSQLSYSGALGNNEDMYAAGAARYNVTQQQQQLPYTASLGDGEASPGMSTVSEHTEHTCTTIRANATTNGAALEI